MLSAALILTIAGPGGARISDQKSTVAEPAQTTPDDFYRQHGVIRPREGIDPNVSVPLFLAPVLWREAALTGRNPGGQRAQNAAEAA